MRFQPLSLLVLAIGGTAGAHVFTSELLLDPLSEGWELIQRYCDPETWNLNGWYHQELAFPSCEPPGGGARRLCALDY